jgi:hypothetical protein
MLGRHAAAGLTDLAASASASFAERSDKILQRSEKAGYEGGCPLACRRRGLPRDALIKLDVERGLAEEFPVRHRLGSILLGRATAG